MSARKRVLTGDRPTGKLHLGHYVGSLQNRVKLQGEYECYFLIADLHMLTTRPTHADIEEMRTNIREMVLDYLAVGIDPRVSTIYLQSAVHAVYEMNLIFEMLVSLPRLTRLPSLKEMARAANIDEESIPFGLIGYPVLQAADILMPRAHLVPVGKDNEAHVEITREIARRFNHLYGEVFPIPDVMLSEVPTLVGTDGQAKMSKSLGNAIYLSDDADTVAKKVMSAFTTPTKIKKTDPGVPENCVVCQLRRLYDPENYSVSWEECRTGARGCVQSKRELIEILNAELEPIRCRRKELLDDLGQLEEILRRGAERARATAADTMTAVRQAMKLR